MIFEEQISRKPNHYPWASDYIDTFHKGFWTSNEFNFKTDVAQFNQELSKEEQQLIVRTMTAIGQIEVAVKTFWSKLGDNLPHPVMTDLGITMGNTEVLHNNAYEKLIDCLGMEDVFEKNLKEPILKGRVDYLRKYLKKFSEDEKEQYLYSLMLFGLFVENVSLFSQFYIGLYFNRFRGIMKDTAQQIDYTLHEEDLHAQVAIKLINTIFEEYPELRSKKLEERVIEECQLAIEYESKVIDWIVGDYNGDFLNAQILKDFIKDRMNKSLKEIGYNQIKFNVDPASKKAYNWINEEIYGNSKTDFFNKKPTSYAKSTQSYDELF